MDPLGLIQHTHIDIIAKYNTEHHLGNIIHCIRVFINVWLLILHKMTQHKYELNLKFKWLLVYLQRKDKVALQPHLFVASFSERCWALAEEPLSNDIMKASIFNKLRGLKEKRIHRALKGCHRIEWNKRQVALICESAKKEQNDKGIVNVTTLCNFRSSPSFPWGKVRGGKYYSWFNYLYMYAGFRHTYGSQHELPYLYHQTKYSTDLFQMWYEGRYPLRYVSIETEYHPRTRTTAFATKRHSYPPNPQNAISP